MHKVSRTLLLAGVMAFGTLTAACGSDTVVTTPTTPDAVLSVTVSPANASINVGGTITLASNVTSTGNAAKTVAWTSSSSAIATVDATGKVTGVSAGTATIIATSTADASKAAAAAILVNPTAPTQQPSVAIASVTQGGAAVNLSNASGQIDIAVNNSGGGQIDVFLSSSCTTNTISASDTPAATQQTTSAQPGTVVLSVNTAAVTASNAPKFPNGNYCIKARLTSGTTVVVATNTTPITLNNANVFTAALSFASVTGGPTSAVSSLNGLAYNQGTMTVKVTPVVFTSSSPVALISGYFTRNGSAGPGPIGNAVFTNVPVTAGVATFVLTDSIGAPTAAAANTHIAGYVSASTGDSLVISSATDAAGNSIAVPTAGFAVKNTTVRIDNDTPNLAFVTATPAVAAYTVTAPNGYIGAAYSFASGTQNAAVFGAGLTTPASDVEFGNAGVGIVTSTYYVGTPGSAAFTTPNSCNVTGLSAAAVGTDLANSIATNAYQAKVVVADKLGNKSCTDVASTFAGGLFGVDKIAPTIAFATSTTAQTAGTVAAASTGYNVNGKLFTFTFSDTISGFIPATPIVAKLVRNFFTANTTATDCVIGTYDAVALTCTAIYQPSSFDITGNPATNVPGYYTVTAYSQDRAFNSSAVITRDVALDPNAPTITGLTQSPAALAPLGTVTVTGAANDLVAPATFGALISSTGRLQYATTVPTNFASVAGTTFGAFGSQITSGTTSVSLSNVYRGLQETSVAGVIGATAVVPTARLTVTDVGRNTTPSANLPIAFSGTGSTPIQAGNTFTIASSAANGTVTASVATTTLTVKVVGSSTDPLFQSQPFSQLDLYKVNSAGELALIGTNTLASVTDNGAGVKTYTFTNANVALTAGPLDITKTAASNTFFAVGRNAAGDAVISQSVTQTNP